MEDKVLPNSIWYPQPVSIVLKHPLLICLIHDTPMFHQSLPGQILCGANISQQKSQKKSRYKCVRSSIIRSSTAQIDSDWPTVFLIMSGKGWCADKRIGSTVAYLLRCPRSTVPEAMRAWKFSDKESKDAGKQMAVHHADSNTTTN